MGTVTLRAVLVFLKLRAALGAEGATKGTLIYKKAVIVPPVVAALNAAELFGFRLFLLSKSLPAIETVIGFYSLHSRYCQDLNSITPAVGFHGVFFHTYSGGNSWVG
jgi:hypothetical protein